MTNDDLNKLSKNALEELGRTKGIELDRRLTKKKLIAQIADFFVTSKKKVEKKEEVVEEIPQVDTNDIPPSYSGYGYSAED
jgi:hypothetical protein|tara:strand:+ start:282 stop:524 length:243 start_codon:yes stop_codon:yes gene_type:complete